MAVSNEILSAAGVISELIALSDVECAAGMRRFFKTGKGEYGEGDDFLGVKNPGVRDVAKRYRALSVDDAVILVKNRYNEVRLCGLLILVHRYRHGDAAERRVIVDTYIKLGGGHINNWNLVDLSAPDIIGFHELVEHDGTVKHFAESENLWEQRIAIISTLTLVRHEEYCLSLKLCEKFLTHKHDLIHKACGWILREIGKRDRPTLTAFLTKHKSAMPRTMLRYAIEHYPEQERKAWLAK